MTDSISVITPGISINNETVNICMTDKNRINIVCYEESDKFAIIHKNGEIPDITLDENTISTINKANLGSHCLEYINKYLNDNNITADRKTISDIISSIFAADYKILCESIQTQLEAMIEYRIVQKTNDMCR